MFTSAAVSAFLATPFNETTEFKCTCYFLHVSEESIRLVKIFDIQFSTNLSV